MRWLSIYRFAKHYISSILGKLEGFLITPLVFPHRDWIRNYAWNWRQVNGIKCLRSTIHSEDDVELFNARNDELKSVIEFYQNQNRLYKLECEK